MSRWRGTPEASEVIYPADASRKDRDSQIAYQHAAAAINPNAKSHSSEATLFVIDHTGIPPPTKAQLLQEQNLEYKKTIINFFIVFL